MGPVQLSAFDWGLVALVAFPLLQLPLVVYLSRYVDVSEEKALDHAVEFYGVDTDTDSHGTSTGPEPERAPDAFERSRSPSARITDRTSPIPSKVACPVCGTENDPAFTFCRLCVARLSNPQTVASPTSPH